MRITVPERIHDDAVRLLAREAELVPWRPEGPLPCDALVVRTMTVDRALMERLGVRVVGSHGAGVDNIDLAACRDLGVVVVNVPEGTANAVAELIFGLLLCTARRIVDGMDDIRQGRAVRTAPHRRGIELAGRRLGLAGFGRIARRTADIGRLGFGMEVHAWSRSLRPESAPGGVTVHASLNSLLAVSDVLCVCVPLNPETRGLIGVNELALLPRGAILVNAARGGVVDETALAAALHAGHLAGAACDVFESEPPAADHPLLACPGFTASQHIGINTDECLRRIGLAVCTDVLGVLQGKAPIHPVP